jgi:site-specific recombinase XerD
VPIRKKTLEQIGAINMPALESFSRMLKLKGYSPHTRKSYLSEFLQLLYALKNNDVNKLSGERLKKYFEYCIDSLGLTESQMNSRINALKFYYEQVLGRDKISFPVPRPKTQHKLPKYLHKNDVKSYLR